MRFVHIADVHLGAKPEEKRAWTIRRDEEIYESFERVIGFCNQEEVDLLLIAGDLFHKQPLLKELKEVNYLFEQLTITKVVLIAGNHDYISARSNYVDFLWCDQVYMLKNDELESIYFEDLNTEVYGFSYHTRDIYEAKYDELQVSHSSRIRILLAHGGDERNIPIDKKRLKNTGFDYIALGHIHKHEFIENNIAYSGSLEPMDKNELGDHGLIYGEIIKEVRTDNKEQNQIEVSFLPFAKRKYKQMVVTVDDNMTNGALKQTILERIHQEGHGNLFRILITGIRDEDIVFDTTMVYSLGYIVEVIDETKLNYDFKLLYQENKENIIGLFIEEINKQTVDEITKEKAMYYGIEALLKARE